MHLIEWACDRRIIRVLPVNQALAANRPGHRRPQLEQVERDQHRVAFSSLPVAQPVEYGEPIFVAGDDLAIDQAGPGREM